MKKFLVLILTLAMVMAMATVASADTFDNIASGKNNWAATNTDTGTVEVEVTSGTVATVYKVDVEWSKLEFNYGFGDGATWDPVNHKYTNAGTTGWDAKTATITVKNHSNASIGVEAYFAGNASTVTEQGVTATLSNNAKTTVETADQATYHNQTANCPTKVIGLAIDGIPTVTNGTITVGTITVTVTP